MFAISTVAGRDHLLCSSFQNELRRRGGIGEKMGEAGWANDATSVVTCCGFVASRRRIACMTSFRWLRHSSGVQMRIIAPQGTSSPASPLSPPPRPSNEYFTAHCNDDTHLIGIIYYCISIVFDYIFLISIYDSQDYPLAFFIETEWKFCRRCQVQYIWLLGIVDIHPHRTT